MKKEHDVRKGRRGAVIAPASRKTRITIRPGDDVLAWFRGKVNEVGGGHYQTLINDAFREYIGQPQEALEKVIRRVLRGELKRTA